MHCGLLINIYKSVTNQNYIILRTVIGRSSYLQHATLNQMTHIKQ
jgi:hypothetical protein